MHTSFAIFNVSMLFPCDEKFGKFGELNTDFLSFELGGEEQAMEQSREQDVPCRESRDTQGV